MNPIRAIIIDDEPAAIETLKILLAEIEYLKVANTFTAGNSALDWLLENQCDLIFLDVEMPNMTGFGFLEELEKYPDKPCIVFTTGFEKYAIEAIKATAFDYLLKPISKTELQETLHRYHLKCHIEKFRETSLKTVQQTESPKKLVFPNQRGFVAYSPDEILYFQADRNYSYIHLTNGSKQIVSMQLGQIEKSLPKSRFFRINRSSIINLKYFTHADQKLRKCFLEVDGTLFDFDMKIAKIKELQRLMMGSEL